MPYTTHLLAADGDSSRLPFVVSCHLLIQELDIENPPFSAGQPRSQKRLPRGPPILKMDLKAVSSYSAPSILTSVSILHSLIHSPSRSPFLSTSPPLLSAELSWHRPSLLLYRYRPFILLHTIVSCLDA